MPAAPPNHRLKACEELAQAAALAEEGRTSAARQSLLSAADHAVDALIESHSISAPTRLRAITILTLRGTVPFDARPLLAQLRQADAPGTSEGADEEAGARLHSAILAVQVLVDMAMQTALPSPGPGDGHGARPWPAGNGAAPGGRARDRPRRPAAVDRRRRLAPMLATAVCALVVGSLASVWLHFGTQTTEPHPFGAKHGFFYAGS